MLGSFFYPKPYQNIQTDNYSMKLKTLEIFFFTLTALLFYSGLNGQNPVHKGDQKDSISSAYKLEEVIVSAPHRNTLSRIGTPSGNTFLTSKDIRALDYQRVNDFSALSPNVWIPRVGSLRATPIYIRGVGSRSGSSSAACYLNGAPIIYESNIQFSLPNLKSAELLRGPQGSLYGRNSLAGVLLLETYSPFTPHTSTASFSMGSYGLLKASSSGALFQKEKVALSMFFQYNKQKGFYYNHFRNEWADPLKDLTTGVDFAWKISSRDILRINYFSGNLTQGAFPYRIYDLKKKEISPVSFNGQSSFSRDNLFASIGYKHLGDSYSLDLGSSFEWIQEETNVDQDYSPKEIFQTKMAHKGKAATGEALFKWHDRSGKQNLSFGGSLFVDINQTSNPIELGKDGISLLLLPVLKKISSNPKLPFNLTPGDKDKEDIALSYKKPRYGGAIYAQYSYEDLFFKGLSLTIGAHLGAEFYAMDYNVASQFQFVATPKVNTPPLKTLQIAPEVKLQGRVKRHEWHLSPRAILGYSFTKDISTYFSFSQGYRAGNFNEQAFADLLLQQEIKALMLQLQGKQLPPSPAKEELISYKPEKGINYEWGTRGSFLNKKIEWSSALFYMHINDLQVTDFVASGLGRIQENYHKGRYYGAEIDLKVRPIDKLVLSLGYGFVDAKLLADKKLYNIPYVPRHTLSASILYALHFDPKQYFFEELSLGFYTHAAGAINWTLDGKSVEPFKAILNASLAIRRGVFSIWAKGYNLMDTEQTLFSFRSLQRTLVQTARPLHFEIGISTSL